MTAVVDTEKLASGAPQSPVAATAGHNAKPVAAYVRMSTEHQRYSTQNQLDRIREYAARREMEIVRIFADEGKSGLHLKGRDDLQRMIGEVEAGSAAFHCILVYDVSRWGRFQDADESGYYEYLCRRAGIAVHYCAEQFENDGSPASNIIKSVKRSMAGEFSRELSTKVFEGACRMIRRGFKQGGVPGLGLRRLLVDENSQPKGLLRSGERKCLQSDHVMLVPGPEEEQEIVREIFRAFVLKHRSVREIANDLNARKIPTDLGREWKTEVVRQMLASEKYIGNYVYHRKSFKFRSKVVKNPPETWVRTERAFPAIVDPALFARAQEIFKIRRRHPTNEELLQGLREIRAIHGRINQTLINNRKGLPWWSTYYRRFGSLTQAYALIGYIQPVDHSYHAVNRRLNARRPEIVQTVLNGLAAVRVSVAQCMETDLFVLAGELTIAIELMRCRRTEAGSVRWWLQPARGRPDLTVAVRLNENNEAIKDYYLIPSLDQKRRRIWLETNNHALVDAYRFNDLSVLLKLAERIAVEEAA
ncbi:MAG: recombinase family protein [Opitutaceae bacterium]|nr:recombinase family protein [Opitutaceae bacterium]